MVTYATVCGTEIKGLRIRRANRWQNSGTLDANHLGQQTRENKHSEEMEPRSILRGSKPTRRHQPPSQRHERRFQDIESQVSFKRFSKERQVGQTKILEETAATSRKTSKQGIRERKRQKLWLLWKDRSAPSSAGRNCPARGQQR